MFYLKSWYNEFQTTLRKTLITVPRPTITKKDFKVTFASEPAKQLFREVPYPGSTGCFKVLCFEQDVAENTDGMVDLGSETWALVVKKKGTSIYISEDHSVPLVVPANTLFLCRSRSIKLRVTSGLHDSVIVLWKASSLPKLAAAFEKSKRFVSAQSVFPVHSHSATLLQQIVDDPTKNFELIMIGILYTTIGQMMAHRDDIDLCPIDHLFPETMVPLLKMVRKDPARYWPIPEAANIVGYSGHHFSRVFKQYSGMRFQSFVERCRTSYAIELLVTTKLSVDAVATKSGFGASQALRDAFKEILGIVPSDLRGICHK